MQTEATTEVLNWVQNLQSDLGGISESLHQLQKCVAALDTGEQTVPTVTARQMARIDESFNAWYQGYTREGRVACDQEDMNAAFCWGVMRTLDVVCESVPEEGGEENE